MGFDPEIESSEIMTDYELRQIKKIDTRLKRYNQNKAERESVISQVVAFLQDEKFLMYFNNRGSKAMDRDGEFVRITALKGVPGNRTYRTLKIRLDYYDVNWKAFFIIDSFEGL